MENASKALIMAGTVLISLLIIGALVLTYNKIVEIKKADATSEEAQRIIKFNQDFESFAKTRVSGSEIISLILKVQDYNERKTFAREGYTNIIIDFYLNSVLQVNLNNNTVVTLFLQDNFYRYTRDWKEFLESNNVDNTTDIGNTIDEKLSYIIALENKFGGADVITRLTKISSVNINKQTKKRTIDEELSKIFGYGFESNLDGNIFLISISNINTNGVSDRNESILRKDQIEIYKAYIEFQKKLFTGTITDYDTAGRVSRMTFTQL